MGAATGALVLAQIIRLASLKEVPALFQMELGAPQMVSSGAMLPPPKVNLGSHEYRLGARRDSDGESEKSGTMDGVKSRRRTRPGIHSDGENAG